MTVKAIRWLLVGLLAALITLGGSLSAADSLRDGFWPPDPTEGELADLAEGFEIVEVGAQSCGQGGSYICNWDVVVAHDRTHEEVQAEIQRVTDADLNPNLGQLVVVDIAQGQSQVQMTWSARDPGLFEVFGALGLLLVALLAAAMAFVLLMAIIVGGVANRRG